MDKSDPKKLKVSGLRHVRVLRPRLGTKAAPSTPAFSVSAESVSFEVQDTCDEAKLNKTERRYYEILQRRRIRSLKVHALRLKLAYRDTYTPEFSGVDEQGRFTIWEVKGPFIREDAWQKLKMAARSFPEFRFIMAQWDGKQWEETWIRP